MNEKRCPLCFGCGLRLFFNYFMPRAFGSCVKCGGSGKVLSEESPVINVVHSPAWLFDAPEGGEAER